MKAGYYIAFPFAVYLIAYLRRSYSVYSSILVGQLVIYLLGFIGLVPFIGYQLAFLKGVFIFIPSALFKSYIAQKLAFCRNKGAALWL